MGLRVKHLGTYGLRVYGFRNLGVLGFRVYELES